MEKRTKIFITVLMVSFALIQAVSSFSFNIDGSPALNESVTLKAGPNITLNQTGYVIIIDALGNTYADSDNNLIAGPGINLTTSGNNITITNLNASGGSGGSGYRNITYLTADVSSTASTSFQNITSLAIPVKSGVMTRFYGLIIYNTSVATIGLRVSVNGGANSFLTYTTETGISATGSAAESWNNHQSTYNAGTTSSASVTTNGNMITIEGAIMPTANYNLQFTFAPETATANGIIIKKGSTVEYW